MSWGQSSNGASTACESSAAPVSAETPVSSTVALDGPSDVVARSISVREMAAKFDADVRQPALTVTAAVVHHDSPDEEFHPMNPSELRSFDVALDTQNEAAVPAIVDIASDLPAHAVHSESPNHPEISQPDDSKRPSRPQSIIEDIMQHDPLLPTYIPPEVEVSPPPFSYSDLHNVDPRGLTFCYLIAEYVNGVIKKRVLKVDSTNQCVSLYKLGGNNAIWSFHFSQLKEVQSSENGKEWDESLPADSVLLVPNTGMAVSLFMCYPVDSISLRLSLNSELAAFRTSKADENAPTRTVHGLRCLLHEGKAYAGSSTRSWNARVFSVYCGRVYVLNSFSDTIPCDIIDLMGCRIESSAQAPCQLILHAIIRFTFSFSSPKVRDVFVNALKQAKTMYETSVTQYSEYCRGMRLLSQQNLVHSMDLKRTFLREQIRLVKTSEDVATTSSHNVPVPFESSSPSHNVSVPFERSSHPEQSSVVISTVSNGFPGDGLTVHGSTFNAPGNSSRAVQLRQDPAVVGAAGFDQASNVSSSSSAAEHNLALRLAQKYEALRVAEFGAPNPRPALDHVPNALFHGGDEGVPQAFLSHYFPVQNAVSHSSYATILPHVIVAVAPISLQLLAADILGTYGHSSKLYLFDVDDAGESLHKLPVQHSESFVFDKDHPPSLASICMSVVPDVGVRCSNQSDIFEQVRCRRRCFPSPEPSTHRCALLL